MNADDHSTYMIDSMPAQNKKPETSFLPHLLPHDLVAESGTKRATTILTIPPVNLTWEKQGLPGFGVTDALVVEYVQSLENSLKKQFNQTRVWKERAMKLEADLQVASANILSAGKNTLQIPSRSQTVPPIAFSPPPKQQTRALPSSQLRASAPLGPTRPPHGLKSEPQSLEQDVQTRAPGVRFPYQRPKPNAPIPSPSPLSLGTPNNSDNSNVVNHHPSSINNTQLSQGNVHNQLGALKPHGIRRFAANTPLAQWSKDGMMVQEVGAAESALHSAGNTQHKSTQAEGIQWTRFYLPDFDQASESEKDNSFFQHFDVAADVIPCTFGVDELTPEGERHQQIQHEAVKWHRLLFKNQENWSWNMPVDGVEGNLARCSREAVAATQGNVLEASNQAAVVRLQNLCRAISTMRPRTNTDLAPLCALQAGILHYLHSQLESIGRAVEERYKLNNAKQLQRVQKQMEAVLAAMSSSEAEHSELMCKVSSMSDTLSGWRAEAEASLSPLTLQVAALEEEVTRLTQVKQKLAANTARLMGEKQAAEAAVGSLKSTLASNQLTLKRALESANLTITNLEDMLQGMGVDVPGDPATGKPADQMLRRAVGEPGLLEERVVRVETLLGAARAGTTRLAARGHTLGAELSACKERAHTLATEAARDAAEIQQLAAALTSQKQLFKKRLQEKEDELEARCQEAVARAYHQLQDEAAISAKKDKADSAVRDAVSQLIGLLRSRRECERQRSETEELSQRLLDERAALIDLKQEMQVLRTHAASQAQTYQKAVKRSMEKQSKMHGQIRRLLMEVEGLNSDLSFADKSFGHQKFENERLQQKMREIRLLMETKQALEGDAGSGAGRDSGGQEGLEEQRLVQMERMRDLTHSISNDLTAMSTKGPGLGPVATWLKTVISGLSRAKDDLQELLQDHRSITEMHQTQRLEALREAERLKSQAKQLQMVNTAEDPVDEELHMLEQEMAQLGVPEAIEGHKSSPADAKNLPEGVSKLVKMLSKECGGSLLSAMLLTPDLVAAIDVIDRPKAVQVLLEAASGGATKLCASILIASQLQTSTELLGMMHPEKGAQLLSAMTAHEAVPFAQSLMAINHAAPVLGCMRPDLRADVMVASPPEAAADLASRMPFQVAAETLAEMMPTEAAMVMRHMSPQAGAVVLRCMSRVAAALLLQQLDKDTLQGAVAGLPPEALAQIVTFMKAEVAAAMMADMDPLQALQLLTCTQPITAGCIAAEMEESRLQALAKLIADRSLAAMATHSAIIPVVAMRRNQNTWIMDWRAQWEQSFTERRGRALHVAEEMEERFMAKLNLSWPQQHAEEMGRRQVHRSEYRRSVTASVHVRSKTLKGLEGLLQRTASSTDGPEHKRVAPEVKDRVAEIKQMMKYLNKEGVDGESMEAQCFSAAALIDDSFQMLKELMEEGGLGAQLSPADLETMAHLKMAFTKSEHSLLQARRAVQESYAIAASSLQHAAVTFAPGHSAANNTAGGAGPLCARALQPDEMYRSMVRENALQMVSVLVDVQRLLSKSPLLESSHAATIKGLLTDAAECEKRLKDPNSAHAPGEELTTEEATVLGFAGAAQVVKSINAAVDFVHAQEMASATDLEKRVAILEEHQEMHAVLSKAEGMEQEMVQQCNSTMGLYRATHAAAPQWLAQMVGDGERAAGGWGSVTARSRCTMELFRQAHNKQATVESAAALRCAVQSISGLIQQEGLPPDVALQIQEVVREAAHSVEEIEPHIFRPPSLQGLGDDDIGMRMKRTSQLVMNSLQLLESGLATSSVEGNQQLMTARQEIQHLHHQIEASQLPEAPTNEIRMHEQGLDMDGARRAKSQTTSRVDPRHTVVDAAADKPEMAEAACQTDFQAAQEIWDGKDLREYHFGHGPDTTVEKPPIASSSEMSAKAEMGVPEGPGSSTQSQAPVLELRHNSGDGSVADTCSGDDTGCSHDDFLDNLFETNDFVHHVVTDEDFDDLVAQALDYIRSKHAVHCTLLENMSTISEHDNEPPESSLSTAQRVRYSTVGDDEEQGVADCHPTPTVDVGLVSELRHQLRMDNNTTWGTLVVVGELGEQGSDVPKVPGCVNAAHEDIQAVVQGLVRAAQQLAKNTENSIEQLRQRSRMLLKKAVNTVLLASSGSRSRELVQATSTVKGLNQARRRVERILHSPGMVHTFRELRHYRKPKKAVVATIAALLVMSANDQIKGVLPHDYVLPEQENAVHSHWLGVQKAMGPKTLQCMVDVDVSKDVTEVDYAICQKLMDGVVYKDLKKVSQATGLLHEWIWILMKLYVASKELEELKTGKIEGSEQLAPAG